jgi:hypothetical protein
MILLLSVFITHKRPINRYSRYEIFKYTLNSYKDIPFSELYFFILLDDEFIHLKEDLTQFIIKTFPQKINITFDRYYKQIQWVPFIRTLREKHGDELVWFTQNDDHVFVDFNLDILQEGIELLKREPNPHKSLYFSHWPEQIKLCGKYKNQTRIQNYVKYDLSLLDSIQIFGLSFLYDIFVNYTWKQDHVRIDSILNELTNTPAEDNPLRQTIYVPLREMCRHFDGYDHVGMNPNDCGPLVLPKNTFYYNPEQLIKKMTASHQSPWTKKNTFQIPTEWIVHNLRLHNQLNHTV